MSRDRPPSFQFYPRDFLSSRAVTLMTPEERGGYIMLLCHAWDSSQPGQLENDDATLARLSGLGRRWTRCREAIAKAFVITPDHWTQPRMQLERQAQLDRYEQAASGGRKAAETMTSDARIERAKKAADAKWQKASGKHPMLTPASASASASEASTVIANAITPSTGVEAPTGSAAPLNGHDPGPTRPPRAPRQPSRDWRESFDAQFWPAYPRHVGKGAALRAWNKLGLSPEAIADQTAAFNAIMDGLDDWKARHRGIEPEFIPHPSTWLNQRRWEDTDR